MATVTKKELIDRIAERTQAKRVTVKRIIQTFLDEITKELCRNNNRLAKRTVKFKMGRLMRENLCVPAAEPSDAK